MLSEEKEKNIKESDKTKNPLFKYVVEIRFIIKLYKIKIYLLIYDINNIFRFIR